MQLTNHPEVKAAIQVKFGYHVASLRHQVLSQLQLNNLLLQQQGHAVRVQRLNRTSVVKEPRDLREQSWQQAILRQVRD